MQDAAEERAVEAKPPLLADHIGVVGDDRGLSAAQQPIGNLAKGVGGVDVGDVGAETDQGDGLTQAKGHRSGGCQPPGFDDFHSVESFYASAWAGVADQHDDLMSGCGLGFGQHFDVVFDAAQDRVVVFVDVKDVHYCATCRRHGPGQEKNLSLPGEHEADAQPQPG